MTSRWTSILLGAAAGVALTLAVQSFAGRGATTDDDHDEEPRGPHGGRLLTAAELTLEVTIYEEGVEPQFRVFPTAPDGSAIPPSDVELTAALERLGGQVDRLAFVAEGGFLRSTTPVEEPHSFLARFTARYGGRTATFSFEQVEGRATIPDAVLASSGIEVSAAGPGAISPIVELPGEVIVPPDRHVSVSSRLPGVLSELRVTIGQRVRRGDVIGVVTSRELSDASAAYVGALKREAFARVTRDREEDLAKRRITAMQDYQVAEQAHQLARTELAAARQALAGAGLDEAAIDALATAAPATYGRLPVRAPIEGVVTEQMAAAGEAVEAGGPVLVLTDAREVWVNVQVHARDLALVREGRPVTIASVGTALSAEGRIAAVNPIVGDETRTATARVVLPNPGGRWRPGLFVSARVALEPVTAPVAVPGDALQTFRDWTVVFVRYGHVFEARPVTVGRTDGRLVEILSGLRPGERFASKNAYAVKADVLKSGASHDH